MIVRWSRGRNGHYIDRTLYSSFGMLLAGLLKIPGILIGVFINLLEERVQGCITFLLLVLFVFVGLRPTSIFGLPVALNQCHFVGYPID